MAGQFNFQRTQQHAETIQLNNGNYNGSYNTTKNHLCQNKKSQINTNSNSNNTITNQYNYHFHFISQRKRKDVIDLTLDDTLKPNKRHRLNQSLDSLPLKELAPRY